MKSPVWRARSLVIPVLLAGALLAGCKTPGAGDGWVAGSLWVENCRGGNALDAEDAFDLRADFFTGDPLFDTTDSTTQRRSGVTLRLQETSNQMEEANVLLLQFQDLVRAAQSFVDGTPIPITDDGLCPGCTDLNSVLRMQLSLTVTCPDNQAPVAGGVYDVEERETAGTARDVTCLLPTIDPQPPLPCPASFSDAQRDELDQLCETADFNDRSHRQRIEEIFGERGACLYLCRFGALARGDDPSALEGFEIEYGDPVSAIFSADVLDTRTVRMTRCAGAAGRLTGMFHFELVRSRVAQPFP